MHIFSLLPYWMVFLCDVDVVSFFTLFSLSVQVLVWFGILNDVVLFLVVYWLQRLSPPFHSVFMFISSTNKIVLANCKCNAIMKYNLSMLNSIQRSEPNLFLSRLILQSIDGNETKMKTIESERTNEEKIYPAENCHISYFHSFFTAISSLAIIWQMNSHQEYDVVRCNLSLTELSPIPQNRFAFAYFYGFFMQL